MPLGFWEVYSIGVGGMIGGGIFAVLGLSLVLAGFAAPVAFLIAGLVAALTGYSYAKLSVRYPSRGGTIEFLVRGFGPGLLSGSLNLLLFLSYTVMIALYAYAFGSYAAGGLGLGGAWPRILAVAVIALFTLINALGVVVSGRVEEGLVFFKLFVLLLVVGAGLALVHWFRFSPSNWPDPIKIVTGGMIIFLAYEGFELIANASRDVRDLRVIPRATYAAIATVIAVYVLVAIVAAGVLSPQEVIKYRDYVLAVAAKPALGEIGFMLVVLGALASTSSAINATLFGTGRASYVVARYGHLPEWFGKRLWREATEGLLIIAIVSALLAGLASLEQISVAGSAGFLLVFTAVNIVAYRLRREARVNKFLALMAVAASGVSLLVLLGYMIITSPNQVVVFAAILAASVIAEYLLQKRRKIHEYIDEELRIREENIRSWSKWVPRLARELKNEIREAEVYLVGSVARGELHQAHDVDLLVVTEKEEKEIRAALERIMKRLGFHPYRYPVDIHVANPAEKERRLKKSKVYQKLA